MSSMAKQARAAMKNKAKSLTSADPHQKVDSSTWSPAEALNTEAKTGMRPVSRRAFKSGGKVTGSKPKPNLGKSARAGGGSVKSWVDAKINRNVKDANEERAGIKHVGGMKKGGRAHKADGGSDEIANKINEYEAEKATADMGKSKPVPTPPTGRPASPPSRERSKYDISSPYKKGGRAKKEIGGPLAGAAQKMKMAQQQAGVPSALMNFTGVKKGSMSPARAVGVMKKGGAVHEDVAADKALIRKMVKPSARTGKDDGGRLRSESTQMAKAKDDLRSAYDAAKPSYNPIKNIGDIVSGRAMEQGANLSNALDRVKTAKQETGDYKKGGRAKRMDGGEADADYKKGGRAKRKDGGSVFSGPSYPGKVPGAVGGRTAHAAGGKAGKGKTDINIIIAAGKSGADDMMPPGGPVPPPPSGRPVPVPPPAAAGAGAPMPMPMPMPMPAPAGGGGQSMSLPGMPRKAGGRITKIAKSYKDMEAGAGSGEGRLQKTDIAKRTMHNKGGKVGHRSYSSYKDMDAGSGSGFGRLEKTEIAKKHSGIQKA